MGRGRDGGVTRIRTGESEFCRLVPYHLAMTPYIPKAIVFHLDYIIHKTKMQPYFVGTASTADDMRNVHLMYEIEKYRRRFFACDGMKEKVLQTNPDMFFISYQISTSGFMPNGQGDQAQTPPVCG